MGTDSDPPSFVALSCSQLPPDGNTLDRQDHGIQGVPFPKISANKLVGTDKEAAASDSLAG